MNPFEFGNKNSTEIFSIALLVFIGIGIIQIIGNSDDPRYVIEEPTMIPLSILSSIMVSAMIYVIISRLMVNADNKKIKEENK